MSFRTYLEIYGLPLGAYGILEEGNDTIGGLTLESLWHFRMELCHNKGFLAR